MIVSKRIICILSIDNKWSIEFRDEDDNIVNLCAIPPTSGNRIDVLVQTMSITSNGFCYDTKYIYKYKENIKRIKGEGLIIQIMDGKPDIKYFKR